MRHLARILAVVVVLLLLAGGWFFWRYRKMASTVDAEHDKIAAPDLAALADGVYPGSFGDFLVSVKLEVVVKEHRITEVRITDQQAGKGREAREVPGRIVAAQTPKVDAVSGATGSSYCIMIAADRALRGR